MIERVFLPFPEKEPRNLARTYGVSKFSYRAHADAGRSQDNFAFAMGHKELIDGYWHVFIDVLKFWNAEHFKKQEDGLQVIDYTEVLAWFQEEFKRFNVDRFTMDQWNSGLFIDTINKDIRSGKTFNRAMICKVDDHTGKENQIRWNRFKTACTQGWVHAPKLDDEVPGMPPGSLLENELKFLVEKNGKVTNSPNQRFSHYDQADCVSTVVSDLLGKQVDAFEDGSLSAVVGAARGGMPSNGVDAQWKAMQRSGDEMMRQLGYM